jgi:hypothetical protein
MLACRELTFLYPGDLLNFLLQTFSYKTWAVQLVVKASPDEEESGEILPSQIPAFAVDRSKCVRTP